MPTDTEGPFWGAYADFAAKAAHRLNVRLQVVTATGNDRSDYLQRVRDSLTGPEPPDYLIAYPYLGAVPRLMEETAALDVKIVTMNAALGAVDQQKVGHPRERYTHWILRSYADDEKTGFDLAEAVVEAARDRFRLSASDVVSLSAIGGSQTSGAAVMRRDGVERYIDSTSGYVALNQFVATDWGYERGREVADGMLLRYPHTQAIWTASLSLGLAAVDAWAALETDATQPAIGVFSGPFDERALAGLETGAFSAVAGGHFVEGAVLMALIVDHYSGFDFVERTGPAMKLPFRIVRQENVAEIRALQEAWAMDGVDVERMTRCRNPQRSAAEFDMQSVLFQ